MNGIGFWQENKTENILITTLQKKLEGIGDVVHKEIETPEEKVTIIYFSSLIDNLTFHEKVIIPLFNGREEITQTAKIIEQETLTEVLSAITEGNTLLYFHKKTFISQ